MMMIEDRLDLRLAALSCTRMSGILTEMVTLLSHYPELQALALDIKRNMTEQLYVGISLKAGAPPERARVPKQVRAPFAPKVAQ